MYWMEDSQRTKYKPSVPFPKQAFSLFVPVEDSHRALIAGYRPLLLCNSALVLMGDSLRSQFVSCLAIRSEIHRSVSARALLIRLPGSRPARPWQRLT